MCNISVFQKQFTMPYDKLESNCIVNPDGWGVMGVDRGKMFAFREFDPDGNDPDKIMKRMEQYKDVDHFALHTRYRTKGDKGVGFCHPFIFPKFSMMHNGTITGYGDDKRVDTEHFGSEIVAPLYEKFNEVDDLFKKIIGKMIGSGNKIVIASNGGLHIIGDGEWITGSDGEKFWSSNSYSFNQSHRKSSFTPAWVQPRTRLLTGTTTSGGVVTNKSVKVSGTTVWTGGLAIKREDMFPYDVHSDTSSIVDTVTLEEIALNSTDEDLYELIINDPDSAVDLMRALIEAYR